MIRFADKLHVSKQEFTDIFATIFRTYLFSRVPHAVGSFIISLSRDN